MQTSLFEHANEPGHYEELDLGDARIREYRHAFDPDEAECYLDRLRQEIPWRQDSLRIAGRKIAVPRLQCWMGDRATDYGYSGIRLQPEPWLDLVLSVRERVKSLTQHDFNCVLLNCYRHGQDSVAWHADDEPELGPNPVIASVSFGAEREFQFRHKHRKGGISHRLALRSGSLLLMDKTTQNNWLHQVPKTSSETGTRINLTFRRVIKAQL